MCDASAWDLQVFMLWKGVWASTIWVTGESNFPSECPNLHQPYSKTDHHYLKVLFVHNAVASPSSTFYPKKKTHTLPFFRS